MTKTCDWQIPPSVLRWLNELPRDRPVVLLLRHSVRDPLPDGDAAYVLPITKVGWRLARELGGVLGGRLRSLHSSPLVRCLQTAQGLKEGAGIELPITPDRLLGDPGVYVVDGRQAWKNWQELGHEAVVAHLVSGTKALQGMAQPSAGARYLVQHMLAAANDRPGVHVFVTHDSLVTPTAARLLGRTLGPDYWPWYLEGAFFWREQGRVRAAYRDVIGDYNGDRLCSLEETDVVEFARREIAATVGLDSGARFFLAGGAFKSLLTGRRPRDLDLWAPSDTDRKRLIAALEGRGARRLPERPYSDAFEIGGRVVEVPHKVTPSTLEERLARFDVGLSAVGVEHCPGNAWSARIDPLARESVQRRQVLLLKPLVNWRHALTTLERVRRYAAELNFTVPFEEDAEIWRVYDNQPSEMKEGMIERYKRSGTGDSTIIREARCRSQ